MICIVGLLAAIAVPAYLKRTKRTKTVRAELFLEETAEKIRSYYLTNGELPGPPMFLATADGPPVDWETYRVRKQGRSAAENQLWETLGWPEAGEKLYFRYTYRLDRIGAGPQAFVQARADFNEGGTTHTVTQKIYVEDDELDIRPLETVNEFE